MKSKPTVTIAIPALNEEANIGHLLNDLSRQKTDNLILEKIIVNSDGSTDNTNEIVRNKNNKKVILIENKETIGTSARQNEMLKMCNSDILVLLDADIEITKSDFLEKLTKPIIKNEADLTSCPIFEKEPATLLEKSVFTSMRVKNQIFEAHRNGDNVYTCHGSSRALSKRFYAILEFKEGPGEDAYSYFFCLKNGFKYKFVKNTYINYRLSNNFSDYRKQNLRFIKSKEIMAKEFGKAYILKQYKIPILKALASISKYAIRHPVLSMLYLLIYGVSSLGYKFSETPKNWDLSKSSKLVRKSPDKQGLVKDKIYDFLRKTLYLVTYAISSLKKEGFEGFVLCYHSIADDKWGFSVPLSDFVEQMEYLLQNYQPCSLNELEKYLNGELAFSKPFFIITFDDGYKNIYQTKEYLKSKGIKPVVFLLSDLSHASKKELDNNYKFLTTDEIKSLKQSGWDFGSHSATHSNFWKLSKDELKNEVVDSKIGLAEKLGFDIKYFSYPKGRYNKRVKTAVEKAGYLMAFSMDSKIINRDTNKYTIPRVGVMNTHSFPEFKSLFLPFSIKVRGIFFKAKSKMREIQKSVMKNKNATKSFRAIVLIISLSFVAIILLLTVRGYKSNPSMVELNSQTQKWTLDGPFELSPERGRYSLLYSLVEDGSFYFSLDVARFALPDLGYFNGKYVSLFAPGVSFIAVPGYVIGKIFNAAQIGTFLVISFFAFLNCILIYKISRQLGAKYFPAIFAFFIFIFATPSFSYASAFYQHHVSTFIILFALYLYMRYDNFFSIGIIWFLSALSISVDYPNFFMMLPIGIATLTKLIKFKEIKDKINIKIKPLYLLTFAFMVLPILFFFWFNKNSYGNPLQLAGSVTQVKQIGSNGKPLETNYTKKTVLKDTIDSSGRNPVKFFNTRHMLNGIYILFFSPDRGVIYFTPVILLGFLGIYILHKNTAKYNNLLFAVLLLNIVVYTMWGDPWGGWAFGARYLIPGYAILAIYLAILISKIKSEHLLTPILILYLYSTYVNTAGALTTNAVPPKVQVLNLEALSGKEEKFNYLRNLDLLFSGKSKSFVFNEYLNKFLMADQYFVLIYGATSVVTSGVLIFYLIDRKKDERTNV